MIEKSDVNFIAPEFLVVVRGCGLPTRPQKVPRAVPVAVGAVKSMYMGHDWVVGVQKIANH